MALTPEFGFKELFTYVIGEIAKSMCERSGETSPQQFGRTQAAVHIIIGFQPRDVIEAMLAGHCLMLHEAMLTSMHDMLSGEPDPKQRSTRSAVVAFNKEFNSTLGHLMRYQARPDLGRRDVAGMPPAETKPAGTQSTDPAAPNAVPATSSTETQDISNPAPGATMNYKASSALVAECRENSEAMTALKAGDPERFAKALGIREPSEAFLEAAKLPGSPFDPKSKGPWPEPVAKQKTG
jgi:hypothetical protein